MYEAYFEDIEMLMIEVVALIVDVGASLESIRSVHVERAARLLASIGVERLGEHLEGDELEEMKYDLKVVGILGSQ